MDAIEADGGTAVAVVADLLDDEACRRAVEETVAAFGGFDTLVNNVAVGDRAGVFDVTPERFHELMDLDLTTAWQMTRHAVEVLPAGSAIVNISSVGVRARGPAMVYNLAKSALENLTVGAANTLGDRGIRVNCVQVGAIWGAFAAANMSAEMRAVRKGGRRWAPRAAPGTSPRPRSSSPVTAPAGSPARSCRWTGARAAPSRPSSPRRWRRHWRPPRPRASRRCTRDRRPGSGGADHRLRQARRHGPGDRPPLAGQGVAVVVTDLHATGVPNRQQEGRSAGWGGVEALVADITSGGGDGGRLAR